MIVTICWDFPGNISRNTSIQMMRKGSGDFSTIRLYVASLCFIPMIREPENGTDDVKIMEIMLPDSRGTFYSADLLQCESKIIGEFIGCARCLEPTIAR